MVQKASYTGHGSSDIILDKIQQQNTKFITIFYKESSIQNTEISILPCVQMPHPQK